MNRCESIKNAFVEFCGDKYKKFMEKLYANPDGVIELKFWQESLIGKFLEFLESEQSKGTTQEELLEIIRDGSERQHKCPIPGCWGDVICKHKSPKEVWGCGECGQIWQSRESLMEFIDYANENHKT